MAGLKYNTMKRFVFLSVFCVGFLVKAYAYDFSAVSNSGHTLYYKLNSNGNGVSVTYYTQPYSGYAAYQNLTGNIIIPSAVEYAGNIHRVTAIGDSAFRNCSNLSSVVLPESIKTIGVDAFRGCGGLTSMLIPDSVTTIGVAAFQYCTSITEITIGKSVRYIGSYASEDLTSLIKTNFTGSVSDWCEISFGDWANPIAASHNLYFNDVVIHDLIIPDNVDTIKYNAFEWDTCLHSISFPSCLTTIENKAFRNCINLHEIRFRSSNPPTIGSNAFWSESSNYRTFYVPCNYYQKYLTSWGSSYNIVCYDLLLFNVTINTNNDTWGTGDFIALGDSIVEVLATPNYGYNFDHWSYGSTANPDTLLLTSDTIITAIFAKKQYSVSGTSNDEIMGSVSGSATVDYLDSVTLLATANYGYHFQRWSDYSIENPRTIAASGNISLTAIFDFNQYTITLLADSSTYGTVSGMGEYNYLAERTISANAKYGYHFISWSDGITDNPRMFTLTQDTQFVALFSKNQYTMTVLCSDSTIGSVTGGGVFNYLDTATLTASATEHYHFVRWSDGNTTNPRRIVVTSDLTRTAIFGIDTHSVNLQAANIAHGTFAGSGNYQYGTAATVEALPYSGYQFTHWSDGATYNPYTFAVLDDMTLTAFFVADGEPWQDTVVVYDTAYITLHDTTYIDVPVHDTTYIDVPVHDTTYITVTDTLTVTQYDTVTNTVYDTVDNYVIDTMTVTVTDTLWLTQVDTVWLHDTIIVHDTVYITGEGVGDVDAMTAKVYASNGHVVVEGANGNSVTLYDVTGRVLATKRDEYAPLYFDAPASGTYMIKIGAYPARKVVVIR